MSQFKTEQESFWAGEFGDSYIERNKSNQLLASNVAFFAEILQHTNSIQSLIEFGANIGMNLRALQTLLPTAEQNAIEINEKASAILKENLPQVNVFNESIIDFSPQKQYDLSMIKGVLIHINPDELKNVYAKLYESSSKYILIAEYYNPSPVEIPYRGHAGKLFKRDFAGEFLDMFPDVKLVKYGFVYRRDPNFPQDDTTWFLLQKQ